jgi:hypothetical protein
LETANRGLRYDFVSKSSKYIAWSVIETREDSSASGAALENRWIQRKTYDSIISAAD